MNSLQKKNVNKIYLNALFCLALFFILTSDALAQITTEYSPLVGLPDLDGLNKNTPISSYINAVYLMTISLGALFGVVKIAIAGVKYSLNDVVTDKEDAKKDIKGVLLGLAILLVPFLVLQTIYPGLTNLDVLTNAKDIKINLAPPGSTAGTSTVSNSNTGTQSMTPAERSNLYATCVGSVSKNASGHECCNAQNYSGNFKCSVDIVNTRNPLGIDTSKVYTVDDFEAMKLGTGAGLDISKTSPSTDQLNDARTYCAQNLTGSTPLTINVTGGYGIVCVK